MSKLKFDPHDVAPEAAPPSVDPIDFSLTGKPRSRLPIIIGIVALLAVGGVLLGLRLASEHRRQLEHASLMERFAALEKNDVGAFWQCLLGNNADPSLFPDNLVLGQRIQASFNVDPLHYPDKVIDDCVPRVLDAAKKVDGLAGPADYSSALASFRQALTALGDGTKSWAERAKTYAVERDIERKVDMGASGFHGLEDQAPPADAIAYTQFLRCAVPDFDKADTQRIVEFFFLECRKPEYMAKLYECGKLMNVTDGKPDKGFKDALRRIGGDDRDQSALADCFKKSRKEAHRDDLSPLGEAWFAFMKAGGEVRRIGASNLKN